MDPIELAQLSLSNDQDSLNIGRQMFSEFSIDPDNIHRVIESYNSTSISGIKDYLIILFYRLLLQHHQHYAIEDFSLFSEFFISILQQNDCEQAKNYASKLLSLLCSFNSAAFENSAKILSQINQKLFLEFLQNSIELSQELASYVISHIPVVLSDDMLENIFYLQILSVYLVHQEEELQEIYMHFQNIFENIPKIMEHSAEISISESNNLWIAVSQIISLGVPISQEVIIELIDHSIKLLDPEKSLYGICQAIALFYSEIISRYEIEENTLTQVICASLNLAISEIREETEYSISGLIIIDELIDSISDESISQIIEMFDEDMILPELLFINSFSQSELHKGIFEALHPLIEELVSVCLESESEYAVNLCLDIFDQNYSFLMKSDTLHKLIEFSVANIDLSFKAAQTAVLCIDNMTSTSPEDVQIIFDAISESSPEIEYLLTFALSSSYSKVDGEFSSDYITELSVEMIQSGEIQRIVEALTLLSALSSNGVKVSELGVDFSSAVESIITSGDSDFCYQVFKSSELLIQSEGLLELFAPLYENTIDLLRDEEYMCQNSLKCAMMEFSSKFIAIAGEGASDVILQIANVLSNKLIKDIVFSVIKSLRNILEVANDSDVEDIVKIAFNCLDVEPLKSSELIISILDRYKENENIDDIAEIVCSHLCDIIEKGVDEELIEDFAEVCAVLLQFPCERNTQIVSFFMKIINSENEKYIYPAIGFFADTIRLFQNVSDFELVCIAEKIAEIANEAQNEYVMTNISYFVFKAIEFSAIPAELSSKLVHSVIKWENLNNGSLKENIYMTVLESSPLFDLNEDLIMRAIEFYPFSSEINEKATSCLQLIVESCLPEHIRTAAFRKLSGNS